ncbi:hypothetical protein CHS0354_040869 [Potamilus streckersoni]|uniref:Uncharacterized protein n=1 Tax=Potamilus streckersoni TaxID=2493646 RepID=A0AAE0SLJ3_9BIVA|nr:hypothetical protein CHS0354_040869 [Potamilus streckersoni]
MSTTAYAKDHGNLISSGTGLDGLTVRSQVDVSTSNKVHKKDCLLLPKVWLGWLAVARKPTTKEASKVADVLERIHKLCPLKRPTSINRLWWAIRGVTNVTFRLATS